MDPMLLAVVAAAVALLAALSSLRRRRPGRRRGPHGRPPEASAPRWSPPAGVEVALTKHAIERMAQRGVERSQLDRTVRAPHRSRADERQGSIRLERDFGDRTLRVWVLPTEPGAGRVVVKTTAWHHRRTLVVTPAAVGRIVGERGARVRAIEARSGARVSAGHDGTVRISGDSEAVVEAALALVREATRG